MDSVRIEQRDETALVVLARPPVNAINLDLIRELHRRLDELAADVPPGGVVITGDGPAFSAGADFKELPGYSAGQRAEMIEHVNAAVTALYGLPTATVAAINGHAIGGAFVLMLACDARLVAPGDVKLGLTEVSAGIPYPAGPMEIVNAEIDPGYRRHLVLSGEVIDPGTARAKGLVDTIVDEPDLVARAVELARLRASAPAYAEVKRQLKAQTLSRLAEIVSAAQSPSHAAASMRSGEKR